MHNGYTVQKYQWTNEGDLETVVNDTGMTTYYNLSQTQLL